MTFKNGFTKKKAVYDDEVKKAFVGSKEDLIKKVPREMDAVMESFGRVSKKK